MDSQSSYSHTDAIKSISNILREPASRSGDESRETVAEIPGEPAPALASQSRDKSSEIAAELSTSRARNGAKLPRPSRGSRQLRTAVWRVLVLCVEPISCRLRDYLLAPLHVKLDGQVIATERIQLQVQAIRADLEALPKQLAQLEFRSRNFAKQLTDLESQLAVLADQLKHLESQSASVQGRIERGESRDHP
jgi:hypothetical protein